MNTSYFSKYKEENGVGIAAKPPSWFTGKSYPALFPKYWFFKRYKDSKKEKSDEEAYEKAYRAEVLDKLDPLQVYEDLKNCVLLCWEKAGEFCHRRIVAKWLEEKLGVIIEEL